MIVLREAIRQKYETHRLAKPGKYPVLKFNSYPAPYEHLRKSFQDELASHGQADMRQALAVIPSIKVFAKVFHDGYVLKDENMINACYLYAWGKPRHTTGTTDDTMMMSATPRSTAVSTAAFVTRPYSRKLLWTSLIAGAGCFLVYVAISYYRSTAHPSRLIISSPTDGMTVPRIMIAEGKASNAKVVWLIIHNPDRPEYYVQDPIAVADDDTWRGPIYTGNLDKRTIGIQFQLRAFVNPVKPIVEGQMIYAWPKAELSSDVITIVRGAQDIQTSTP